MAEPLYQKEHGRNSAHSEAGDVIDDGWAIYKIPEDRTESRDLIAVADTEALADRFITALTDPQGAINMPIPPSKSPVNHPFQEVESCTLSEDNKIITLVLARDSGPSTTLKLTIDAACAISARLYGDIQCAVHRESGRSATPPGV